MRRTWRTWAGALILCLLLLFLAALWNPFAAVEFATDMSLRLHGVKHRYVTVDGHRIHYLETKPEGNGPDKPLLLIHGLGARSSNWALLIPGLRDAGYHVYALDLLGYGRSPKPPDGDYSIAAEEALTLHFMDALHLANTDVAGWSMGGWIAAKVALDRPAAVRRLLLLDAAGMYFVVDFDGTMFSPGNRAELDRMVARLEPDKPFLKVPGFAAPGMLRQMQKNRPIVQNSFASMLSGRDMLDFRIHALKMPVLILWGTEDKLIPFDLAERMHASVENSVLVGIRGCGHLAPMECSSFVLPQMVRFLDAEPSLPRSQSVVAGPQR